MPHTEGEAIWQIGLCALLCHMLETVNPESVEAGKLTTAIKLVEKQQYGAAAQVMKEVDMDYSGFGLAIRACEDVAKKINGCLRTA